MFFDFFESKQHLKLNSFSLVPGKGESSLLLINSGMAPMKKWFLGTEVPQSRRVVTCQKCVRTVDLQNVGKTDRHGTFFEMLGNFSFGDYFKAEAISFAWEFVTKVLKMPVDRLYITVFENDDEAAEIWHKNHGVPRSHIFKLGKADNFWEIGKGPCGPCSEIYFDRGKQFGCGKENCCPGCDCDRFVEFWNLVFSQYCNEGNGIYSDLSQKNIDTGMGLERLACLMQGVSNLFEVDSVKKILLGVCGLAKISYGDRKELDVLVRIVVDHIRSSVFLISDGVLPSNEGRGYVLRKLIRRAVSCAKSLKIESCFLGNLAEIVVEQSGGFYSELNDKLDYIKQVLTFEEKNFDKILASVQRRFFELTSELKNKGETKISAQHAFKLCDTFGMPFDLLSDLARTHGFEVDESGFNELLNEQKEMARKSSVSSTKGWQKLQIDGNFQATEFVGYDSLNCTARLCAIFLNGKKVSSAKAGDEVGLVFEKTSFYAQGGGQVGDVGFVCREDGLMVAEIMDCKRVENGVFVHEAVVLNVPLKVNEHFTLKVQPNTRKDIARNHTAAHILHQVLIEVLGEHVHQAGQLVNDKKMRFDFSHLKALSDEEMVSVENKVNEIILDGRAVTTKLMSVDDAKKLGAKALFDEKYGDEVRVVEVDRFSVELCGGTHVKNSSELGLFKIISESSVGSGVRRLEALTGFNALKYVQNLSRGCGNVCESLKVENLDQVNAKFADLKHKLKLSEQNLEKLKFKISTIEFEKKLQTGFFNEPGFDLAIFNAHCLNTKQLRSFGEKLIDANLNLIALVCSNFEDKFTFVVVCGKNVVDSGVNAGVVVKDLAKLVGKNGGGRPSLAMAGVDKAEDFEHVRLSFVEVVRKFLG